jgi:hypothetical protein
VLASYLGEEDPGDWEEVGPLPLREQEQRMELEVSSLVEMQPLFCQSGSEPALPSISDSSLSHSLCVSYHCSVSFSQMAMKQKSQIRHKFPEVYEALPLQGYLD